MDSLGRGVAGDVASVSWIHHRGDSFCLSSHMTWAGGMDRPGAGGPLGRCDCPDHDNTCCLPGARFLLRALPGSAQPSKAHQQSLKWKFNSAHFSDEAIEAQGGEVSSGLRFEPATRQPRTLSLGFLPGLSSSAVGPGWFFDLSSVQRIRAWQQ